jgi:hypothetical protein
MAVHKTEIQTQTIASPTDVKPLGIFRYRWRCTCGRVGKWREGSTESGSHGKASRAAGRGGDHHVAAMERG